MRTPYCLYQSVCAFLRWGDIYNLIWEMYDAVECIRFIIVSISGKMIHNSTVQSVTLFEGNSGMCIVYVHSRYSYILLWYYTYEGNMRTKTDSNNLYVLCLCCCFIKLAKCYILKYFGYVPLQSNFFLMLSVKLNKGKISILQFLINNE